MYVPEINVVASEYDAQDIQKANYEKVMNILGYIPVISFLSGLVRLIEGAINSAYHTAHFESEADKALGIGAYTEEEMQIAAFNARKSYDYIKHSEQNMARGCVEMLMPLIGNIVCLAYDIFGGRNKYPAEKGSNVAFISSFTKLEPLRHLVQKKQHEEITARLARIEAAQHYAIQQNTAA